MASEIATATVELGTTAEQISTDIVSIEHVSEETVKAAAAITIESDVLAGVSEELRSEISRFTHNAPQDNFSTTVTHEHNKDESRMTWLKPSASHI
jgi:hypothetical protein